MKTDGHRASRLPRAGRGRASTAAEVEKRIDRAAQQLGRRDEAARVSQGQGAAADGDPAPRPRGGARAGPARLAPRVVRAGPARVRRSARSATRSSTSLTLPGRGRGPGVHDRGRGPPGGELGDYQGPRGRQGPSPRFPTRPSRPSSTACARASPAQPGRACRGRGRRRLIDYRGTVDGEPFEGGEGKRPARRARARDAASRASRRAWWAPRRATSGRST